MVRNVAVPTLQLFAPVGPPNGTAAIVAPGGAYTFLRVDHEGMDLASWLAARGVTAFVLRYRVRHTPVDDDEMRRFAEDLEVRTTGVPWRAGRRAIVGEEADHGGRPPGGPIPAGARGRVGHESSTHRDRRLLGR